MGLTFDFINYNKIIRSLRTKKKVYTKFRIIESNDDLKDVYSDEIIFIGSKQNLKWALIKCPCGCKDIIHVNLMQSQYPNWEVTFESDGTISFYPSLWVSSKKCGSHFVISHSRIFWVRSKSKWFSHSSK